MTPDNHVTRIEVFVHGQNGPAGIVDWMSDTKGWRSYCDLSDRCEWDEESSSLRIVTALLLTHLEECEAGE